MNLSILVDSWIERKPLATNGEREIQVRTPWFSPNLIGSGGFSFHSCPK